MSIPHIETGTESEGRLFYFGVMPYYRGKGIASRLHLQSLHMLKEIGLLITSEAHILQMKRCREYFGEIIVR